MTEAEWLATADPGILLLPPELRSPQLPVDPWQMLKHVAERYASARKRASGDRKLRLFACACCRRHWPVLTEAGREVVAHAEAFAEGRLSRKELHAIRQSAAIPHLGGGVHPDHLARIVIEPLARAAAYHTASVSSNLDRVRPAYAQHWGHLYALGALVRDIFGNPFRTVAVDPGWLTSTVVALATGIYADRAFDRLPILADALMDAGCTQEDVLNHCRQPGEHVRGCWVVDILTGRK